MLRDNTDNLELLSNYQEQNVINLIFTEALKGKIQLLILHNKKSRFITLEPGQINEIWSKHPNKAKIILDQGYSQHGQIIEFSHDQEVNYSLLWVNKILVNDLLHRHSQISNKLNPTEDKSQNVFQKYTTPLIELMAKAIEEFWLKHDADAPPKQEAILDWLMKQGIVKRQATAIDLIMRPPQHKLGGNKSRKKSKGDTQKTLV